MRLSCRDQLKTGLDPPTPRYELRDRLTGTLVLEAEAKSYLHIWSGRTHVEVDLSGIGLSIPRRDLLRALDRRATELAGKAVFEPAELVSYGDQPVVPGSSLKGAVRTRLEMLSKKGEEAIACFVIQRRPYTRPRRGQHGWRHYALWEKFIEPPRREACGSCVICDLFGSPGQSSRISFGNLKLKGPVGDWIEELQLDHGERVLAVKPGATFEGEITFEGLKPEELGLLAFGMRLHEGKPILMGKSKYRKRVRTDTGQEIYFGRLLLRARELRLALWCEGLAKALAEEAGVPLKSAEGGGEVEELVLSGRELEKFLKHLVEKAKEAYPGFDYEFDEISRLEEIWREEHGQGA